LNLSNLKNEIESVEKSIPNILHINRPAVSISQYFFFGQGAFHNTIDNTN